MDEKFIEVLYQAMGALGVKSKEEFEQGLQILGEEGISMVYQQYQQDPTNIESLAQVCAQIIQQRQQQQQAVVARMGAQLNYINQLRGKCPEGYEVERYMKGGCVKCKKSSEAFEPRFKKYKTGGHTLQSDSTQINKGKVKPRPNLKHVPEASTKPYKEQKRDWSNIIDAAKKAAQLDHPLKPRKNKQSENTTEPMYKKGSKVKKCGNGLEIVSKKTIKEDIDRLTKPITEKPDSTQNKKTPNIKERNKKKHNELPPHVRERYAKNN